MQVGERRYEFRERLSGEDVQVYVQNVLRENDNKYVLGICL